MDCVDDLELVAEKDDTYTYLRELTATGLPQRTTTHHEVLIGGTVIPQ